MDPILQQLQHYYRQHHQEGAMPVGQKPSEAGVNAVQHRQEAVFNPPKLRDEAVFNPWWLKLRRVLQHEAAHSPQAAAKHFTQAND